MGLCFYDGKSKDYKQVESLLVGSGVWIFQLCLFELKRQVQIITDNH